jgi:hypothetical protein
VVAAVMLTAAAPACAQDVLVGIGDQSEASLGDSRLEALHMSTARIVLPWDVVFTAPTRLAAWVDASTERGVEPLIALGRSTADRCPGWPCVLPSDAAYRAAFSELHARFPSLRLFTPWNEPNHGSEPTAWAPAAAAHYADIVAEECPDCTVVAGDVLDAPGMLEYLAAYRAALHSHPAAWGLHNYYDTTYFRETGTGSFIKAVDGPVWLTESGGIVTWRTPDGVERMPYDESRAAASLDYGLRLAVAHSDRIARMYVYQWRSRPLDEFDAGLIRPDGQERPALDVLRKFLAPVPTADPVTGEGPAPATLVDPETVRDLGKPARIAMELLGLRNGWMRARVRCTGGWCRGRLTVEGNGRFAERLVNGRTAPGTLAPRHRHFALAPGTATTLRVRIPRHVRRRGTVRVKLSLVPDEPGAFTPVRRAARFPRSLQTPR